MIRVEPQPEPLNFDASVRQPGLEALAEHGRRLPAHWRRCLNDLHAAYRGICAYACIYIDKATGARSVEHFVAKSSDRQLAYEWSNYRLACSLVNSRKGAFDDVLDPFEIEDGWFVLEFLALQILPNPELDSDLTKQVQATIQRLGLDTQECRDARAEYFECYVRRHIDFHYLERKCPFVAKEMKRLALVRSEDR